MIDRSRSTSSRYSMVARSAGMALVAALLGCPPTPPPTPPPPTSASGTYKTPGAPTITGSVIFTPGGGGKQPNWAYTFSNTVPASSTTFTAGIVSVMLHATYDINVCTVTGITPASFTATNPANTDILVEGPLSATYTGATSVTFTVTCDLPNVTDNALVTGYEFATSTRGTLVFSLAGPEGKH